MLQFSDRPECYINKFQDIVYISIVPDYEILNQYIDFANAHLPEKYMNDSSNHHSYHHISIEMLNAIETVSLCLKNDHLIITSYRSSSTANVQLNMQNKETAYKFRNLSTQTRKLLIYADGRIMTAGGKKNAFYPSTVNDLRYFSAEIKEAILELCSDSNLLYKDFLKDEFRCPLCLSELKNLHNKREYFQSQFPNIEYPKSCNAMHCEELYQLSCAAKYIVPDQQNLLFQKEYRIFETDYAINLYRGYSKRNQKYIATQYLESVLVRKLTRTLDDNSQEKFRISFYDYIRYAIDLKQPIDLKLGKNAIVKKHDEYAWLIYKKKLRKQYKGKQLVIPDTPLAHIELPGNYQRLDTIAKLCAEAEYSHNCVAGYDTNIEKGRCMCYAADVNGEHVTIEIRQKQLKNKISFNIKQCYTYKNHAANQDCLPETYAIVQKDIAAAGERYNTRN